MKRSRPKNKANQVNKKIKGFLKFNKIKSVN